MDSGWAVHILSFSAHWSTSESQNQIYNLHLPQSFFHRSLNEDNWLMRNANSWDSGLISTVIWTKRLPHGNLKRGNNRGLIAIIIKVKGIQSGQRLKLIKGEEKYGQLRAIQNDVSWVFCFWNLHISLQTLIIRTKQGSHKEWSHWTRFKSLFWTEHSVKKYSMNWEPEVKNDISVLKSPEYSTPTCFIKKIKSVVKLAVLSLHTNLRINFQKWQQH